jgi:hypothetical protein
MAEQSLTFAFTVEQSPREAFDAINDVRGWWSGNIEGETNHLGDEWSYRYEDMHYSKQKITEFVPGQRVVWHVEDSFLGFVEDKTEWTDTDITFDISTTDEGTEVRFTHRGLIPSYECFTDCSNAWGSYINESLQSLITTGKGEPNKSE